MEKEHYMSAQRKIADPITKAIDWERKHPIKGKIEIPEDWWQEAANWVSNTPDAPILERKAWHVVFLYDAFMQGYRRHIDIEYGSEFYGHGFTADKFCMWRNGENSYLSQNISAIPLPVKDPRNAEIWQESHRYLDKFNQAAIIKGEIHLLRPATIFLLDKLLQNMYATTRKRVLIDIPWVDRVMNVNTGQFSVHSNCRRRKAWMYVGRTEFWNKLIDHGYEYQTVNIFNGRPEYPPYYFYTKVRVNER